METSTAASHAPSTMMLGVNPKHPDYSSTDHHLHDPIHVMEQAKQAMEEWMTIIVPNVIPRVRALQQQVVEFKKEQDPPTATTKENNENSDNHSTKKVDDTLQIIFDQTMACERQIQTTYDRLHTIKGQIRDAMTVPAPHMEVALHYLSPIAQLPVFGGRRPVHTASQDMLHDYYQHDFLARYETATVEYDRSMDDCQHVLLHVSNLRSSSTACGRRTH